MSAEYKDLIEYTKKLKKQLSEEEMHEFWEESAKELASRVLADAIERTPTITGNLKRNFTGGAEVDPRIYVESLPVEEKNGVFKITIKNPTEYASYVEYGHRTPDHKGFVEGQMILTKAVKKIQDNTPIILTNKIYRKLERATNGNK